MTGTQALRDAFAALWQALSIDGSLPRTPQDRRALLDHVRDALDRGEDRLSDKTPDILANTFTLEEKIHEGSTSQVYHARHRDLGTLHAIKMLRDAHATDPIARQWLLDEATIGLALRHPAIVGTQACLRLADGRPAVVFDWCGETLSAHLRHGKILLKDVLGVMNAVLEALAVVHDAGFVHCDLSPWNLLVPNGDLKTVKLGDFGIALAIGGRHDARHIAFAGQRDFASPEQRDGHALDSRADLYAAGRLLSLLLNRSAETITPEMRRLRTLADTLSEPNLSNRPKSAYTALAMLQG